jgi:uncharacterized membrane protein YgdD (TMEM256/DUF423 family)
MWPTIVVLLYTFNLVSTRAHIFRFFFCVASPVAATWTVASTYHLLHAAAILGVAALCKAYENEQNGPSRQIVRAGQLLAAGTTMFSGSIYLLALGIGPKKILGPTTPIGGMLMIGGWAMLGLASSSSS